MQNGWHTMRKSNLLLFNQVKKQVGNIFSGIDLFNTNRCRYIRKTPGVDVKHRRYGHVDIISVKSALLSRSGKGCKGAEGVKHQLSVTEINAFGQSGRAGSVKSGCSGIFIKIFEFESFTGLCEELFIFAGKGNGTLGRGFLIVDKNILFNRIDTALNLFNQRKKFAI